MPHTEQITYRPGDDLAERIEQYQQRHGLDSAHEAAKHLTEVGYRESKSPVLYRLFDLTFGAAFYLVISAIITVIGAYMTPVMRGSVGVRIALVMIAVAVGLLGMVELARALNKQNALGQQLETVGVL